MKLLPSLAIALALMSGSVTFSAESPAGDQTDQPAVTEFAATIGDDGTFGVLLHVGEAIASIDADCFKLGDPKVLQEGQDDQGNAIKLIGIPATANKVGKCHVVIKIHNAVDGSDRTVEMIVTVHAAVDK